MKFGRKCQLSVEVNPDANGQPQNNLTLPSDCSIDFMISRQALGSSQTANFTIRNLAKKTSNLIYADPQNLTKYRAIQFRAGYNSDPVLPLCFNGWVFDAVTYKPSPGTEDITEINAYDGGVVMANGFTAQTIISGTSVQDTLKLLANSLPKAQGTPLIGSFPQVSGRGRVLFGNTWQVIMSMSNGLAMIDNGQVKILNYNECVEAEIPTISAATGLLGGPKRGQTNLTFDMLFEPRLTLGQIINLQSTTNKQYNGLYKVVGFTHRGTISPAVCGDLRTTVNLFIGQGELSTIQGAVVS